VEDRFPYMVGWVNSDVAISGGLLQMSTSYLWQLAETHALFDWSYVTVFRVNLTLEGPKPQFNVYTTFDKLDEAIRKSTDDGWLKMLGIKAESWEGLKRWVSDHWDEVIDAVKRRIEGVEVGPGFDLAGALVELEGLKSRLDDNKIAREVLAPALLLIQAERLGVNEETLRYFAAVASGAIGGDGHVSAAMRAVGITSGNRTVALLWATVLAAHSIKTEVRKVGSVFQVVASGDDAARLAGLYFLYGPPLLEGDERIINHKLAEAVRLGAGGLNIRWEGLKRTEGGLVVADMIISEGNTKIKYNVYLSGDVIKLEFASTDRSRVELAARLLKRAGVTAEVRKVSSRDAWRVWVTTNKLAAGYEELRKALAQIVKKAMENGWIDAGKAEGWLEKLEKGLTLMEGWPRYHVGLKDSALEVSFGSTDPVSIEDEARRFRDMGLEEGKHFSVKMPEEGGGKGYVYILKEGLAYAAWLKVYGSGRQRELAAEFVEYILQRAREEGDDVYKKALEIVKEGMAEGSLRLEGFEGVVEVGGKTHVVKVVGGGAELEEGESGKLLLRIRITAEVDGVRRDYTITYSRRGGDNAAFGRTTARADAPGGREADAERLSALIKALTGKEPRIRRRSDGQIEVECSRGHLEGFMRFAELADAITRWLEETRQ
jgi:hypothetical protein